MFSPQFQGYLDSSERARLHSELWEPWQKLRLFDTDMAMEFLLPFYPPIGRPAKNQPQILRSFILFFLLFSKGLIPSSLTFWVDKLKNDRLWAAPSSGLYSRDKLLPATWNSRKPEKPKGRRQKAQKSKPKITQQLAGRILDGKDIPFHFEQHLQQLFYRVAVIPSMECGLIPEEQLTVSGDGTAVHTHACPCGRHRKDAPENLRHFPDPDASWGWDSDLEKYYFGYTLFQLSCYNSELKTDVPRGTDAYKKIYNQRTATKRINNRILNDYGLHRLYIHRKEHYSFMTTMIGICLHLDSHYKQLLQKTA